MSSEKRKQSLYFPNDVFEEIKAEAIRQDRSLSWIVQRAWVHARTEVQQMESIPDIEPDKEAPDEV